MDMQKKRTVIVVAVCVGLWATAWALTPVLERHNENFPDTFNDLVLHERVKTVKTFPTARDAPKSGDGEGQFVLPRGFPRTPPM